MSSKQLVLSAQAFLGQLELMTGAKLVIAGGFVRDAIMERPFRDVDLYVKGEHYGRVHRDLTGDSADWSEVSEDEASDAYVHQAIMYQQEFDPLDIVVQSFPEVLKGHPINLIGLREDVGIEPEAIVSRFNFGICQAALTKDRIYVSEEFKHDYANHQFTLLRTDWGMEGSMRQYEKLKQKYNWPLVKVQGELDFCQTDSSLSF